MPDIQQNTNTLGTAPKGPLLGAQTSTPVVSSSPWDEPLPTEEKKPEVIGTLSKEEPLATPPPSSAFALPANPEENVVPKSVTPADLPASVPAPTVTPAPIPAVAPIPTAQGTAPSTSQVATPEVKEAAPAVPPAAAEVPPIPSKSPSIFAKLAEVRSIGLDLMKKGPDTTPNLSVPTEGAASADAAASIQPTPEVGATPMPKNTAEMKPAISGDIALPKPVTTASNTSTTPTAADAQPSAISNPQPSKAATQPTPAVKPKFSLKIAPKKLWIAGSIVGVLAIFSLLTWFTELGFISIGLERVYGAVNLQTIWGGLPANGEFALAKSFVAMRDNPNFEVAGGLTVDIDRTKNSTVTKPLVSYFPDVYVKEFIQKANLAVYTGYDADGSSIDATTTTDPSDTSVDVTSDSTASTPTTVTASDIASSSKQEDFPSYQNVTSTIKQLRADVSGSFTEEGGSTKFFFKKPVGSTDVEIKQQADKLWLKSKIAFTTNQDENKWMEIGLGGIKAGDSGIAASLFSASPSDGLSATGSRVGNEKIGKIRAYHYTFKSLEIGDSLISLGIKNEMVNSISGDVWIGIKDKMIKKVELKITPTPSYSVTLLNLSLTFDNYGKAQFSKPATADILAATFTETAPVVATPVAPVVVVDPAIARDEQRRTDLASIKTALLEYKAKKGAFPISSAYVKINTASNVLTKALVPTYIAALPKDSKDADGWYYSYKSSGKTFTLQSKMELEAADTTKSGTSNLYYLSNQ